jgi:deoxyribodipyrimidine photo-lyase
MRTLVWFRGKDLRLADHAPLTSALASGGDVIPLFVLDPYFFAVERARKMAPRIQYLLEALGDLEQSVAALGSRLVIAAGKSVDVVPKLTREWKVERVVAQAWCAPLGIERDRRISQALAVPFDLLGGETIADYGSVRTKGGTPFAVFTPFSRAFAAGVTTGSPLARPKKLPPLPKDVRTASAPIPTLASLGIERNPSLVKGGEREATKRLEAFIAGAADHYAPDRDRMDLPGTSRLSADLKFGTISPRTVWTRVDADLRKRAPESTKTFLNEICWREFAHATLWDHPEIMTRPFRADYEGFPYLEAAADWAAWVEGRTGYPVVDASARQLLGEGFVHNRARMISASFLTKHLLIDYRRGEAHYMEKLVDGDWAQNMAGWQWSAGSGCDAQPYFRVFNPTSQGTKFDPSGDYVRRWVPELAKLPAKFIHEPASAPDEVLRAAGVVLGKTYPRPIVDHKNARARFLEVAAKHLAKVRKGAIQ